MAEELQDSEELQSRRMWIGTFPCGCIGTAALATYLTPREIAQFVREGLEDGAEVENVSYAEFNARGGVTFCEHDPQWGGVEPLFEECPGCWKRVQVKKAGGLRAHKAHSWSLENCDQTERVLAPLVSET